MKCSRLIFTAVGIIVLAAAAKAPALPSTGLYSLSSPDHRFEVTLSDNPHAGPYDGESLLTIKEHGHLFASYPFSGELVSGYWSPGGKYLAIDNHCGHRGWHVWIISLRDGSVMTSHGKVHTADFDMYMDEHVLPDIDESAQSVLRRLTPDVDDYDRRNWPISIAYGWKSDDELLMFHAVTSDELADRENTVVCLRSILRISRKGMKITHLRGEKAQRQTKYPQAITAVLHWTD